MVEERNRLARDLHDAVSQTLFSLTLTAEAAAELIDRDPAAARVQLAEVGRLAAEARAEMRSLVFQLRPADLEADGLVATLRKHVEVLDRVHPARVEMTVRGDGVARCGHPARALPDRPGGAAERAQALGGRPDHARARAGRDGRRR